MPKYLGPLLAVCAIAGCTPAQFTTEESLSEAQIALAASFCTGSADPTCRFINSPVQLQGEAVRVQGRAAKFFRTANRLSFTDGRSAVWLASSNTLTDGASIPRIFIPIVGSPTDPAVVNAAAVHDAHCGIGNELGPEFHSRTWEETHRMFYDALRVGGTAETKAKLMFAAVYLGGPRWDDPARDLTGVSRQGLIDAMRAARAYIRGGNPGVLEIEEFLKRQEKVLTDERDKISRTGSPNEPSTEELFDPGQPEPPVIVEPEPPVVEDPPPPPVEEEEVIDTAPPPVIEDTPPETGTPTTDTPITGNPCTRSIALDLC